MTLVSHREVGSTHGYGRIGVSEQVGECKTLTGCAAGGRLGAITESKLHEAESPVFGFVFGFDYAAERLLAWFLRRAIIASRQVA